MNRKFRGSQKLIVSALGLAIAVPLAIAPASAAIDSGFLIHAENSEDAQYWANAGLKSANTAEPPYGGGGGSTDEPPYGGGGGGGGGDYTDYRFDFPDYDGPVTVKYSDTEPYLIHTNTDGTMEVRAAFPETRDGYNHVTLKKRLNGSVSVHYTHITGIKANGAAELEEAPRFNGPNKLWLFPEGGIQGFIYGGSGELGDQGEPYTADYYNRASGEDWDGFYHTFEYFGVGLQSA